VRHTKNGEQGANVQAQNLKPAVQTPILDRFGDVGGLDFFGAGEVGDGAADFEDPAVGAGAQAQLVDSGVEQFFAIAIHGAITFDIPGAHLGVGVNVLDSILLWAPVDSVLLQSGDAQSLWTHTVTRNTI